MEKKLPADKEGAGLRKHKVKQAPADKERDTRDVLNFPKDERPARMVDELHPMRAKDHCGECKDPTGTWAGKGRGQRDVDEMSK